MSTVFDKIALGLEGKLLPMKGRVGSKKNEGNG